MKRRYMTTTGIGAACMFAVLVVLAMLPVSGVTNTQFQRIEAGMTKEQVEAVFGTSATESVYLMSAEGGRGDGVRLRSWRNEDGSGATIWFDDSAGTVRGKEWQDSTETIGEKLGRWVRWPWW